MASPRISWPASDGLSPLKAKTYEVVQALTAAAFDKTPPRWIGGMSRMLPLASRFLPVPGSFQAIAEQVHRNLADMEEAALRGALLDAHTMTSKLFDILLDESQSEEVTPDGSSHDGATIEDPISAAVNADAAADFHAA